MLVVWARFRDQKDNVKVGDQTVCTICKACISVMFQLTYIGERRCTC